jgi:hypothetical protein
LAYSQAGNISGKVTDQDGKGVAGAAVLVPAAHQGVMTGPEGDFKITVPAGAYLISVRGVGFRAEMESVVVLPDRETRTDFQVTVPRSTSGAPPLRPADATKAMEDSSALFGTWRWVRTGGGMFGANLTPPSSGWSRLLTFHKDGSYVFSEHDSVANYLLCRGRSKVDLCELRPFRTRSVTLCIDLEGWWWSFERRQLVSFQGRDTIMTYPGAYNMVVADASAHTFVREPVLLEPAAEMTKSRPPRVMTLAERSYHVDLPSEARSLWYAQGPLHEWWDWQYPEVVRRTHRYAHDEIPSAVVADFDKDGAADVAIHASTEGYRENKVVCLLSNHGAWRAVTLLSEPTAFDTPDTTHFREPHPTLFLGLLHAKEGTRSRGGTAISFRTDVILVARPDGYATPYYMKGDAFVAGDPVTSLTWKPQDPR